MFYSELFKCVPLKVEDKWVITEQDKTLSGFKRWIDYVALEESKLIDYLLRLDVSARQLCIDDTIRRLLEALNQLSEAYKGTDNKDVWEIFLAVRGALGCIDFRFKGLGFACSMNVINRWSCKFPFMQDFPALELASTDAKGTDFKLPIDIDTPRARKYIGLAIEKGFIAPTDSILKWKQSKARLAYFLFRIFCKDDEGKDNGLKFPESALNRLFGEDRLGKARSQLADNKKQGYEDIDRLFD